MNEYTEYADVLDFYDVVTEYSDEMYEMNEYFQSLADDISADSEY